MPRRGVVEKREVPPDPKYGSKMVTRFVNSLMRRGKKSVAEGIFYGALDLVAQRAKTEPIEVFQKAMENVRPYLEVRSRRVGGATYQVPVEVRTARGEALAIRWLLQYARARGEKSMTQKLAGEFLDASQRKGGSVKKREDTHKMAEANKAFAHYRW